MNFMLKLHRLKMKFVKQNVNNKEIVKIDSNLEILEANIDKKVLAG